MTIPEYISAMLCAVGLMMITLRFCMWKASVLV